MLAHTPATGPQVGLQAADLRTVTHPEKGQGHWRKMCSVLRFSALMMDLSPSVLVVKAKSGP